MNKGLAIVEVSDTETKSVFIDQEVVEFARLHAQTKKRVAKAEREKRIADSIKRKSEKVAARRRAYNIETLCFVLSRCGIAVGAGWCCAAGMIHPVIGIAIAIFSLCGACLRVGEWIGRSVR